jgi:hypothetical protein
VLRRHEGSQVAGGPPCGREFRTYRKLPALPVKRAPHSCDLISTEAPCLHLALEMVT